MLLVNPIFLWALAGLSIPIGIHLLSRKEGKVIKLGSVRHVLETSTQQFKGIKLNEILLLALRCAMIIIFSLLLSGLQCTSIGNQKWVLIEKGLENVQAVKSVLDSLNREGYELHLLSEKFPLLKDSVSLNSKINYYKLMEQLQTQNLSQAIVFAKNGVSHFKGMQLEFPKNVRWVSVASPDFDYPLQTIRTDEDSLFVRMGHTNTNATYFTIEKTNLLPSSIEISSLQTIDVLLVSDEQFGYDQKVIKAALRAIEKSIPIKLKLLETNSSKISPASSGWVIWLSEKPIPKFNTQTISLNPRNSNELLIHEQSDQWVITKRLNQEVALHENLTLQLAALLIPEKALQNIAIANDRRMLPDSLAWAPQSIATKVEAGVIHEPADRYLIIGLLLLLLTERIIAYQRNQ